MHEVVQIDESYNNDLRINRGLKPGNPKSVDYETETIFVLKPKLWIILPDKYKNLTSLVRIGCLQTAHAVSARHTFKMLALFNFN